VTIPYCLSMAVVIASKRVGGAEHIEVRLNPADLPGVTDVFGYKVVRSIAVPAGRAWVLGMDRTPLDKSEVVLAIRHWRDQPPRGEQIARLETHGGTFREGMTAGEVSDAIYIALAKRRQEGSL
jgi:hypothetical protein